MVLLRLRLLVEALLLSKAADWECSRFETSASRSLVCLQRKGDTKSDGMSDILI